MQSISRMFPLDKESFNNNYNYIQTVTFWNIYALHIIHKKSTLVWLISHIVRLNLNCYSGFIFWNRGYTYTGIAHTKESIFPFFYLSIYPSIFDWNYQSKSAWTTFHLSSFVERRQELEGDCNMLEWKDFVQSHNSS